MREENIEKMNFKELRAEVQLLRDEIALLSRKFYQELQLLDSSNFSKGFTVEQDNMKAQVQITANAIKTLVSETDLKKTLEEYSTIEQTENAIKTKVSKTDLKNTLKTYSTVEQLADALRTVVAKKANLDEAIPISCLDDATDENAIYVIQKSNDSGEVISEEYYYYNSLSEDWELLNGDSIYTVFEQTEEGFALRGNVLISGDVTLKSDSWYSKMNGNEFVICDGKGNEKLKLGANSTSDKYEYPYMLVGAGESEITKGCIAKMQKGLWIGDSSVYNYENVYPGTDVEPVDGAETSLGTGIFFDFESDKVFLYQGGKIALLSGGSSVAVFG